MNYLHLLQNRFACKEFNKEKVSTAKIHEILQAGVLSPSSLGLEPWTFYVLQSPEKIEKLKQFCNSKKQFETCAFAVILASKNNFEPQGQTVQKALKRREDFDKVYELYSPYLKRLESKNAHEYGALQCYIAATNMVNCAHTLGVDSCIIGGYDEESINKEFLPKDEFCALVLTFGYKASGQPKHKKMRFSFNEKVKFI
ncbi:nitroreductase family protein [Campylobacter canadensis]|uniref:Nitroreductase family protein n=1 Tax=Campylobacter canadensis TaxID=449520 RepID=A0ABS7WRZ1_9BACT|nr:nitroreductase family protein [Campylobacter canadensis]MBZ7987141.1 nitroreductase family protein [Campylobacter canadensis]MBZ7994505.1 nitroreductase family protein [Campylobacter canadensis]MBZ7998235.1 nitroreductase family protein [Campylobacter canadensis]MBZ7999780.1 nitroreductase family protein [Campylobacter canadensis]MBZ8002542.1 nitroreductase family protein [Campylobacter canadensis]